MVNLLIIRDYYNFINFLASIGGSIHIYELSFGNIMIIFLLTLALCNPTIIINKSNESWNNIDQWNYDLAVKNKRCKFYYPESPCMKYFIKKKPQVYNVICGKEK